jgi:hypothetical protein
MPPFAFACVHCGKYLNDDKGAWQGNCRVKDGDPPMYLLHSFAMVRRPS